jgi:hypothetical protein
MPNPPAQVYELFGQQERVKQIVRCRLPVEDEGDVQFWLVVVGHGDEHDEQGGSATDHGTTDSQRIDIQRF